MPPRTTTIRSPRMVPFSAMRRAISGGATSASAEHARGFAPLLSATMAMGTPRRAMLKMPARTPVESTSSFPLTSAARPALASSVAGTSSIPSSAK